MTSGLQIDFVSPLPPVRSGISDYSSDLLPLLENLCDLRLVRIDSQPIADSLAERWQPVGCAEAGVGGRIPLYQMGNNTYHREIYELALDRPGIVTLHDVVLHHLLVERTLAAGRFAPYLEGLTADHGWIGSRVAAARKWGELGQAAMFSLAANRTFLRRQLGIVVHSRWAAEQIREQDPEIEVREVPMGIPLPPPADVQAGLAFRWRLGLSADTPLIGSMGFQTPIKRTGQVIAALGREGMEQAHLLVAGEVSPVLDLQAQAEEVGAADRVHLLGFLDFAEFEQAIAACDLCVNLRYPTAGETSASLLRVLAVGRPAIVSDYAHSAELPDEVVVKIPLGEGEVDALASRVGGLLANRSRLQTMAAAARTYIERVHDPRASARALITACEELAPRQPPVQREATPIPPSSLVWRELNGEIEVALGTMPWEEGEARHLDIHLHNHGPARWLPTAAGEGGVTLELAWHRDRQVEADRRCRLPLVGELGPGQTREFRIRSRRPLGAAMLTIEAVLCGGANMKESGGPRWVRFF